VRSVLITGSASGIGKAATEVLLGQGWHVLGVDLNADAAYRLEDELALAGYGEQFACVHGDVANEDDITMAVQTAIDRYGSLDAVVNNAATQGAFGPVTDLHVEDWDRTFDLIVRGTFLGIKHAARVMKAAGSGGAIVNVASIAGSSGDAGPQAYSAAKAAVIHMTRVFATELGPDLIRVNSVSPGPTATALNPALSKHGLSAGLRSQQPLPRLAQPRDIATVIAFLLSDDARLVSGQDLAVDGGLLAAGARLGGVLGSDPRQLGSVGFMTGSTGQRTLVRGEIGGQ
jgi:NAD(P)-dependent dehydrogenase (short-subunit alcohol dehydrogenase family)